FWLSNCFLYRTFHLGFVGFGRRRDGNLDGSQETGTHILHRIFEIAVRDFDAVVALQLYTERIWEKLVYIVHFEIRRIQWDDFTLEGQCMCNLAEHPIVGFNAAIQRAGREDWQKVRPRCDLVQDDGVKLPAVDALDVVESVDAVGL